MPIVAVLGIVIVGAGIALAIALGGKSSTTTVVTQQAAEGTPPTTPGSPASSATLTTTVTATKTSSTGGGGSPTTVAQPSLSAAERTVVHRGYDVADLSDYRQDAPLAVLIGVRHGSADGTAQQAFFFAGGRYIGTDTSEDSAGIRVASQRDSTVTLTYALYAPGDAMCCPSDGQANVRYHWTGKSLEPLDPIPPNSDGAANSRR
jgi:LppP/LprE lipoprotein